METVLFYFFSGVAIIGALLVILLRNSVRALLSLIVTMFALAVLYVLLGAYFIAVANIIVYAGAVLVLFLFVIMLQGMGAKDTSLSRRFHPGYLIGVFAALLLFTIVAGAVFLPTDLAKPLGAEGTIEAIGLLLFQ